VGLPTYLSEGNSLEIVFGSRAGVRAFLDATGADSPQRQDRIGA
jgi:hypothetical protein